MPCTNENNKKLNNHGVTLVEMILVCLFVGIISLMVAQTVVFSYRITTDLSFDAYASNVSEMILDQIGGVINQAKAPGDRKVYFSKDGKMIAFEVANSSTVIMYTSEKTITPIAKAETADEEWSKLSENASFSGKGYLNIYYCQLKDGSNTNPASLWTFPKESYMGYEIKTLKFSPVVHNDRLSVKVDLTIARTDGKGEEYSNSTTVRCYNVEEKDDYAILKKNKNSFSYDIIQIVWTTPDENNSSGNSEYGNEEILLSNGFFNSNVINRDDNTRYYWKSDEENENKLVKVLIDQETTQKISLIDKYIELNEGTALQFEADEYDYELLTVLPNTYTNEEGVTITEYTLESIDIINDEITIRLPKDTKFLINVNKKDGTTLERDDIDKALNSIIIKKSNS